MTSEESKAEKPNRQIFDMAMEKTKCSDPATAYHVGTSIDYDVSIFTSHTVHFFIHLPQFLHSFPLSYLSVTHMDDFTDLIHVFHYACLHILIYFIWLILQNCSSFYFPSLPRTPFFLLIPPALNPYFSYDFSLCLLRYR